jgi:hypothetical protein
MALVFSGCGDKNSKAVFSPESGHPSEWSVTHKTSAKADLETCFECHGENLDGGIANVSCSKCHPAASDTFSKHPFTWGDFAYARHKGFVATNGTSTCANAACHGTALSGVAGSGPACDSCHLGGNAAKHPAIWLQYSSHGNFAVANGSAKCSTAACHGTDAKGVFLSGPSCFTCHPADPTVATPIPDKHPHNWLVDGSFKTTHKAYLRSPVSSLATCYTSICHGVNGGGGPQATAPKCFGNGITGCH